MSEKSITTAKRWQSLLACAIISMGIGISYSWSVFAVPLAEYFGINMTQASLTYTINSFTTPVVMILSGLVLPKFGSKPLMRAGGVILLIGFMIVGAWKSLFNLYVFYGIFSSTGMSIIYGIVTTEGAKIFPARRGMATGIILAGLGVGMIIVPMVTEWMLNFCSILTTLKILGVGFFILVEVFTFFVTPMPEIPDDQRNAPADTRKWTWIFRTPIYYVLLLMLCTGVTSGLMITSQTAVIGSQVVGMSTKLAAYSVSFVALANTIGRFVWGSLSDKLGRIKTLAINFVFSACMLVLLTFISSGTTAIFIAGVMGIGFSYGGFMSIMPPLSSEAFGPKDSTLKFAFVYIGFAGGGFLGPMLSSLLGDVRIAFIGAAIISCIGLVLVYFAGKLVKTAK